MIRRRWDGTTKTGARARDLLREIAAASRWEPRPLLAFARLYSLELVSRAINHVRLAVHRRRRVRSQAALLVAVLQDKVRRLEEGALANVFEVDALLEEQTTRERPRPRL